MPKRLTRLVRAAASPPRAYNALNSRSRKAFEITRARVSRVFGRQEPMHTQIIVCGYSRSGTSLLYNMLSTSLDGFVFANYEQTALATIWKRENNASKHPGDIRRVGKILRKNIHSKRVFFTVPMRDIRDIITSVHPIMSAGYYIGYDYVLTRMGPRPGGVWRTHDAIAQARAIAPQHLVFVRYEDLIENPDRVQDQIAGQTGIRFARRFSVFHEARHRHAYKYEGRSAPTLPEAVRENSPADLNRIGKWRRAEHYHRIVEQFTRHPELFRILREDGYETDDSWFARYLSEMDGRSRSPAA